MLDPAGYGPLTITKGISIQAHGWGSITQTLGFHHHHRHDIGPGHAQRPDSPRCKATVASLGRRTVISGNATGVNFLGGVVNSYGDNYIRDNGTPVAGGSLTPVSTQ